MWILVYYSTLHTTLWLSLACRCVSKISRPILEIENLADVGIGTEIGEMVGQVTGVGAVARGGTGRTGAIIWRVAVRRLNPGGRWRESRGNPSFWPKRRGEHREYTR